MTDDPFTEEAIRRLKLNGPVMNNAVDILAQAIAADKWNPPVDQRVLKAAQYVSENTRPRNGPDWLSGEATEFAKKLLKLVDGAA